MGVHVKVNCSGCGGTGRTGDSGHFYDWCKECGGTGGELVWEENLGEAQGKLLQKQIDDANL